MTRKTKMNTEGLTDNNPPHTFMKIYLKQCQVDVKIGVRVPPGFRARMIQKTPCYVTFVDMSNREFQVLLVKKGRHLWFTEGWTDILEANQTVHGDLFLFKLIGPQLFHIEIFDLTQCHKSEETTAILAAMGLDAEPNLPDPIQEFEVQVTGSDLGSKKSASKQCCGPFIPNIMSWDECGGSVQLNVNGVISEVQCVRIKNDKFKLGKGWTEFATTSSLKEGDILKFVLVEKKEIPLYNLV